MLKKFEVFLSNRLEVLYQRLKNSLFGPASFPFTRRLVIVYGPAMKNWLMLRMAQDPQLEIALGIEFIYLNQAFDALFDAFRTPPRLHIPTQLELALAIEKELKEMINHFVHFNPSEQKIWMPLISYLKLEMNPVSQPPFVSRKAERRLIHLSRQLARYFQDYGRYAGELVEKWEAFHHQGWQQQLWARLFKGKMGWSYPCREFRQPIYSRQHCEIHVFSISFVTHQEWTFFERLSDHIPLYYYLLSPCAVFWSDIRSDKENAYLQAYWQQRLGNTPQVTKLEELLRDRNALLANFGRLGREMASYIEESVGQTQSSYVLPSSTKELDLDFFNEDLTFEETDGPLTLLHAIQTDILLMRNPNDQTVHQMNEGDLSIQLHAAPTKQREIQILYHNLMRLIDKESPHLYLNEIIVMAPCIMEYVPYIQNVFGAKSSQLDFQILDLGMQSHNAIVQGFLQLLALSESRWDATHLLQLFGHQAFQRRHQLAQSDYYAIQEWIEKAGIRWGEDLQHRNELLERHHCQKRMVEETSIGTWDYGLTRLLLGLTSVLQSASYSAFEAPPYDQIDFSQGDLLGQWIRLLHALRDDLTPLHDRTEMTLGDWSDYLICLLENYFLPDLTDTQSLEDFEDLKSQFEVLRTSSKSFTDGLFSFESIKAHLHQLLQQRAITYQENHVQTIRFCSMMPLRSIPAKVIALVGMQEGAFPRMVHHSSLNLMVGQELADYCPQVTDLDRYLFLEVLHSAQDYLLMSYQGYNYKDNKELQPSLLIEELFSYLDKHYAIQGKKISNYCLYKHPFDSFNELYFKSHSHFANYSFADFRVAHIYYKSAKQLPHRFIREFILTDQPEPTKVLETTTIHLKQLAAVARNPIKFHLNQVLDIYIENEEERQIKNEEDLYLSSLDKYLLKQSALKEPLEEVLIQAEKEGKMPLGLFKSVASKWIEEEVNDVHERLEKHSLKSKDLFQIEFCTSCLEPIQLEPDYWLMPAIAVPYSDGQTIHVVGKINQVSTKGLVIMSKGSLADVWKVWPHFLLYNCAAQMHPDNLERQLIMTQSSQPKQAFFDDPIPYLKQFIDYYHVCLRHFSPLLPDWLSLILEGDTKGLQDKMRLAFSPSFGDYQSQDLRWILHKNYLPNSEKIIEQWKTQAEVLLGDLIRHWYADKHVNALEKHETV